MFWGALLGVLGMAALLVFFLYVSAVANSVDEPYFRALRDVIKQLWSGDFWA